MFILSRAQMAQAESLANLNGISNFELMLNAGNAAADEICKNAKVSGKSVLLLCGKGNNGGDGFVVANRLYEAGATVTVWCPLGLPKTDCAKESYGWLYRDILRISSAEPPTNSRFNIAIDALFGTGFSGVPDEISAKAIEFFNSSAPKKYALDIPSGTEADTGRTPGAAAKVDTTFAFAAYKYCHFLPSASSFCGEVKVLPIGISDDVLSQVSDGVFIVGEPLFEKRDKNCHKGTFGTALSVVGSYGMAGAAIISSRAALKSGVGILKVASHEKNYTALSTTCPEAVQIPLDMGENHLFNALDNANSLLIGCGIGTSDEAARLVKTLLEKTIVPTVLDADGINNIVPCIDLIKQVKAPLVLTPHSGEMARMLGKNASYIEADRMGVARAFATEYGVWLCLKGANTIVAAPDGRLFVNISGNPGMATAGSGDVLAGLIAGLAAYMPSLEEAVLAAVYLHSQAGDKACDTIGERSMTALDILSYL